MRAILYLFIAIFVFGILEPSFTNKAIAQNSILIQSTDSKASSILLTQSAQIISARLKDFSPEKFDIKVIPEKNQILVSFTSNLDLKTVEKLLTQIGSLAFYETYDRAGLTELLNGDKRLFSLFSNNRDNQAEAKIGCTTVTEVEKVTNYLKTLKQVEKCKFVWDEHYEDSNVCLYALKTDNKKGALIVGKDIESVQHNQDKVSKVNAIDIKLKKSAIEIWADATKRNLNHAIAIVLDNNVLAAPTVRSVINGGHIEITGSYTQNQAKYIAALGNNGVLPLHFKIAK
jgi:preprotein translocase subunit SecD